MSAAEAAGDGTPTVSIVIAVLNARDALRSTLDRVREQAPEALERTEVVVVDGGSVDGTQEVARSSGVVDVLISEPDDGIYDAMNRGAAAASGRFLHFLNAGDAFADREASTVVLEALDAAVREGRTWLVAGARYSGPKLGGRIIPNVPHVWWRHALGLQPHCHQAVWFDRGMFLASGGYSLRYGFADDFDLILRWGLTGEPQSEPRVVVDYQEGGLSDARAGEVPGLLARIRRDRLALDGPALAADRAVVLALAARLRALRLVWTAQAVAHRILAPRRPTAVAD